MIGWRGWWGNPGKGREHFVPRCTARAIFICEIHIRGECELVRMYSVDGIRGSCRQSPPSPLREHQETELEEVWEWRVWVKSMSEEGTSNDCGYLKSSLHIFTFESLNAVPVAQSGGTLRLLASMGRVAVRNWEETENITHPGRRQDAIARSLHLLRTRLPTTPRLWSARHIHLPLPLRDCATAPVI